MVTGEHEIVKIPFMKTVTLSLITKVMKYKISECYRGLTTIILDSD